MSVMAAEAGTGLGAAAGAGPAAASPVIVQGGEKASRGVLLAIAIILLWLAGLCFFIAFEGSQILGEAGPNAQGGGFVKAIIGGLAQKAYTQEQGGA
jgi:hypothetical protein